MAWVRLEATGRGSHYSQYRGLVESVLRVAYRGDWPATLWGKFRSGREVGLTKRIWRHLPPGAAPLRVGFISDVHVGPTTPVPLLQAAFEQLVQAKPDVLLLGGDYVYLDATEEKASLLAQLIERVPARRKFAVLGNHDLWTHHGLLEEAFKSVGVEMLLNESRRLETPGAALSVVGLDDGWTGSLDATRAFERVGSPDAVLVLCHSPDGIPAVLPALASRAPALYMCGHTHGGHFAMPWGPIRMIVPGPMGKLYPSGFHSLDGLDFYVSRGVGGVDIPFRTYAPPEVVVFDLLPRET